MNAAKVHVGALVAAITLAGCTTPTGEFSTTTNRHEEQLQAWQQQLDRQPLLTREASR